MASTASKMENGASESRDPSGFLSEIIGAPVTIKLNSGVVYKGISSHPCSFEDLNQAAEAHLDQVGHIADLCFARRAPVSGWIHEHCSRADQGVRRWKTTKKLRRCLCEGQQRSVTPAWIPTAANLCSVMYICADT